MSILFREVKDDEGNVTYEAIEVADIPEEIIRESDTFKGVLAESVSRRQQIADLKKASEDSSESEDKTEEVEPPVEKPVEPKTPAFDEEATYKRFKERLAKEQAEEQNAVSEHQTMVNRIASTNNVDPKLLRGNTEAELTSHAQALAQAMLNFSELGANTSTALPAMDDIAKAVNKRFGWADDD